MTAIFLHGALCDGALRQAIFGCDVAAEPAVLADHAEYWVEGQAFSLIRPEAGVSVSGVRLFGVPDGMRARLTYYLAVLGMDLVPGPQALGGLVPGLPAGRAGAPWQADLWRARFGPAVRAAAADVMAQVGQVAPQVVGARYGQMLVRGASRVRAAAAAAVTRRFRAGPMDIDVAVLRQPYAHFFAIEESDLAYRRFDGSLSPVVTRAVFVSGDAVTVLPYDPTRDRVLVIEQFRAGPWGRGDAQPWSLEAIAGRIDPGEAPEDCARREAEEEAGLTLGALWAVAQYYPSPGAVSEYLYSYVGLADLPDGIEGVFGVEGEAEDIRGA